MKTPEFAALLVKMADIVPAAVPNEMAAPRRLAK
jgi:hypothetical protein